MSEKLTDKDKWLHFGVCLAAAIMSPMLAIGLAIGKEYGDKNATGNHWCWLDLLADGIGIVIGTVFHFLIYFCVFKLGVEPPSVRIAAFILFG